MHEKNEAYSSFVYRERADHHGQERCLLKSATAAFYSEQVLYPDQRRTPTATARVIHITVATIIIIICVPHPLTINVLQNESKY